MQKHITVVGALRIGSDIIGGIGILRHKNWARYLVMIHSVLDIFNVPIGSALGVYCISSPRAG